MRGKREMVNSSADDANTIVDDEQTMLPEQGQEKCDHIRQLQLPAHTLRLKTPEPPTRPPTPQTHTLSGRVFLEVMTPYTYHPAAQSLREAEAAGNSLDFNVQQQIHG